MNSRQLREQRARVAQEMLDITNGAEGRLLTREEIERWEACERQISDIDANIRIAEAREADEASRRTDPAPTIDPARTGDDADDERSETVAYARAYGEFLRHGPNGIDTEARQLLQRGFVTPKELRAQGVGTASAGGYTVPEGFRAKIIERLKAWGSVESVAEVITTETGNPLPWPTNDDTANVGAILAENTAVAEQDVVLGTDLLGAYTYTSRLIRVSLQLLQDTAFDLEGWLSKKFAERLGRATNAHFTTGTGSSQPQGVVTGSSVGKVGATGQTLTVTYNDLVDLLYSVDSAYRQAGSDRVGFMAHDLSIGSFRKIRDDSGGAGLGRPIWEPSIQVGQPDSLLGHPILANNDMPVMAASAKSILFGDYETAYIVRRVLGIQSLRLEERYAEFLQVGFLAFLRTDGKVQDANAVKHYQNSAS